MTDRDIHIIGYASGVAAPDPGCSDGPIVLSTSSYLTQLTALGIELKWVTIIKPRDINKQSVLEIVSKDCSRLAEEVSNCIKRNQFFLVFGGDHSCAIGTWSGAYHQVIQKGALGLIWIDAHLDSHTEMTSETGNIHGMPLATLLGYGHSSLTNILSAYPKLDPSNVCIIGARSYERGEEELIKKLNIRVFFMDEIRNRGLDVVMQEAIQIVSNKTAAYGVTIDIDSIDPEDAPGTGVSEPGGLKGAELCHALQLLADDERLIGTEIVEFDPHKDVSQKTEKLISQLLQAILKKK